MFFEREEEKLETVFSADEIVDDEESNAYVSDKTHHCW